MTTSVCENCPIYKKWRFCSPEDIKEWLESEAQ